MTTKNHKPHSILAQNQHPILSTLDMSNRRRLLTAEDGIRLKDATILWTKQLFEVSVVGKTTILEEPVDVVEQRTSLEVRRLSDVVRELNLRHPLLLKLDVQGFEEKVIAGGEDVVARTKIIIIEVSFQPLYDHFSFFFDRERE
jgi:FkbM family methyltransferase